MKRICFFAFFFFLMISLRAGVTVSDSLLTERNIRSIYVNYPDSALQLLDEAEKRHAPGILPFRTDLLRAMCHEIKGDLTAKEDCARRALQNDSIRLVPERKLPLVVMLVGVLERQNKYEEGIVVCREAINLARSLGKKKEEAEMLYTMARIYIGMADNVKAIESFERGMELLEGTNNVREMANLSTIYGEYMTFLITLKQQEKAIEIGYRRDAVIHKMSELPGPPPGYIDQQYGFLYAKMAVLLHEAGRQEEAAEIFRKYLATHFSQTLTGKQFGIPYLLDAGRYREAAEQNDACLSAFTNDTVSYAYLILLEYRARAYRGMKRFELADASMQRCSVVKDSIYARENNSKAQEYASKFNLKEKELQLSEARALSERRMLLLSGSCIVAVLLFVMLWIIYVNLQRTRKRNRIAVRQIDELLAQREELRKAFMKTAVPDPRPLPKETGTTIVETDTEEIKNDERDDYALFMRMENILVGQKLFLKSGFGRDDLVRITNINKNDLSPLLRKYADVGNLNDYLNGLRIEYSIKLMKEKPYLSIDAIAEEANFNSRSTFYRAFVKIWGMTPTQYVRTKIN